LTLNNKFFSSLHTHTVFCDGKDDVETMCRSAFDKGLGSIGFSAHAPVDKSGLETSWHLKSVNLGKYIDEVNAARIRWEGKISVFFGLEVDYIKGMRSPLDRDLQLLCPDYIIGSVHYLVPPRGAPFTVDGPAAEMEKGIIEGFDGDGEAMMHSYWDAVAEMIAIGGFDIAGHLDLLKKSNCDNSGACRWYNPDSKDYKKRAEEIAAAICSAGIVVEVNTGGLNRGYINETFPSPLLLGLLHRYNVPVMISADAHRADDLDGHYADACQTLLDAGYSSHFVFDGKKNGKPQWRKIEIQVF